MTSRSASDRHPYWWMLTQCRRWLMIRAGQPDPGPSCEAPQSLDWPTIQRLASAHAIEPVLHALSSVVSSNEVPDHLRARWERAYYGTRIQNAEALEVLDAVIARCERHGLRVAALKGPGAIATVYDDIGLRVMADLDVLCRPQDLPAVAAAARGAGFVGGSVYMHHVSLEFGHAGGGLLELHFAAYDARHQAALLEEGLTQRVPALVDRWTLPVLSLEHQLVYDIAHIEHHDGRMDARHALDLAGRLFLWRDVIRWPVLDDVLARVNSRAAFVRTTSLLEAMFGLPLREGGRPEPGTQEPDPSLAALLAWSYDLGIRDASAPLGDASLRARRHWRYLRHRLCPPLAAVQAAFDLRTRAGAACYLPVYIAAAVSTAARRGNAQEPGCPP